jgi:hypothetical protein
VLSGGEIRISASIESDEIGVAPKGTTESVSLDVLIESADIVTTESEGLI